MTSVEWGLPIVANYYLAGLAAGSYITYYLWQGFGLRAFRPVAKLAWISAAVFAVASPLPVLAHLGQPGPSYYLFTTFHWTSSLAWAGPILVAFILAVLLNGRFFFYPDVVLAYRAARGFRRKALRILMISKPPAGAVPPTSAFGLKVTGAIAFVLALFFGYPGLELGILGSRPLWANPANPLMFLVTAVVSGMAFTVLLWILLGRRASVGPAEAEALRNLILPASVGLFLVMNVMAYLTLSYASPEVREAMGILATGELGWIFVGLGLIVGALLPAFLLTWNALHAKPLRAVAAVSTLLLVVGAFAQKYGFVVAGQVANPPGGQTSSLWPTVTEIVELAAVVALLYFLLQVALWISPWRTVTPEPESPTEAEVPA